MGITPLVMAAATVGGAVINANATSDASQAATNAANQNNALQSGIYNQNSTNLSPFMQRGNAAGNQINGLLGLNGGQANTDALNSYLNSTGYNFNLQSGANAINTQAAATGSLNSGATLKALTQYGQNTGTNFFQNYLSDLSNQQGVGLSGANALAGVGTNYANAVSANNNSAASAAGNAALAGANGMSNALSSGASAYGIYSGLTNSSFGGGSQTSPAGDWSNGPPDSLY